MNPKGYKFEVQIYIEKMEINSSLSFQVQVILKCGNQKVQAQQLANFNQGKAIINETICIRTNVYKINGIYQEKKIELLILLKTKKSNKKAGQCQINIAELLNQEKYDINQELLLENCPDSKAKIYSKIQLKELGEIDFQATNSQSQRVNEQSPDKNKGIFTPLKQVLENTAKNSFGDNENQQSQMLEISFLKNSIKNPVTDDQSKLISSKSQQNLCPENQFQQELQHLHDELKLQRKLYMEIKDQNNQLKQEIHMVNVKNQSLILQIQEQRQQIEKMIDLNIYREQIYQYEQQQIQIQGQLRQAKIDNENLLANYKNVMQQNNKLSEEYNQQQKNINSEQQSTCLLMYKLKEMEEISNKQDQFYKALEKSYNDSQFRNSNFEDQIIQLNQQLLKLKNMLDEKDIQIKSQTENFNSLNKRLLNQINQNNILQQNQQMLNDQIDVQSKYILKQQEQINQQTTKIKQQYEDLLDQNQQTIQQLNNELKLYQTTFQQTNQLEVNNFLKQIEKSGYKEEQTQTDFDLQYQEKEQKFQYDLPNQLIELHRAITLKFSKLKQNLEFHLSQIEQSDCDTSQNQHITHELTQAKLKIDYVQNENLCLQQQLETKSQFQKNLDQQILNQNEKIQNLEIYNKDIRDKSISQAQVNKQLSEQIKALDNQNQDLQIQIKALQIEILQKEDLIQNQSSKIQSLNQLNQQYIIVNEQLQFQIKEQIHNAQQLQQQHQICQKIQDQKNNDFKLDLNQKLQDLEYINQQLQEQILQKENQIEKLQKDLLQQQDFLIQQQILISLPTDQKIEDQSKTLENQHFIGNLLGFPLIEESQKSQDKQLVLEQKIEQQNIQFNYDRNTQFSNIQSNQRIIEKMKLQTQQQESQINQLKNSIKELELKNQKLETEKINISNNYQQALIEAQSLNHFQDNSNHKIEKIQEEIILLKCRIGDMLNEAQEYGGAYLVDKLQQALGIKE